MKFIYQRTKIIEKQLKPILFYVVLPSVVKKNSISTLVHGFILFYLNMVFIETGKRRIIMFDRCNEQFL